LKWQLLKVTEYEKYETIVYKHKKDNSLVLISLALYDTVYNVTLYAFVI